MRMLAEVRFFLRTLWQPLLTLLLCALLGLAQAQSATDDAAVDPPGRIARLSYADGELGLLPAGAQDWSDASINRPLTTGDRLSTGQNSRAELELGGGALRIGGQTDFGLLNLNDQLAQIELTQGSLNISVRYLDPGQSYEIDTPTVALVIDQPGTFRVDIDANGQSTEVTALAGDATVYGENSAQRPIDVGHRYRFDDSGLIHGTITDISGGDAFDAWCSDRDRQYAQSTTDQYVSEDVVGYQDLAQNGSWDADSDYGAVWYPSNVDSSWAPYQDGSWAYIAPWGWSWIDRSRWGFAPYHYGRWAHTQRGWCWIPGPIGVRPVYAPALVAFVGGAGWNAGARGRPGYAELGGAGTVHPIGWFPLGPGDIYSPWYRGSRRYYDSVNLANIRVNNGNRAAITSGIRRQYEHYRSGTSPRGERYVNRDAPHGFTAVPGAAFASGQNVRSQLLELDPHEVAAAVALARGSGLRPATNAGAPPRSDRARTLPLGGFQRSVVAREAPPNGASGRNAGPLNGPAGPHRGSAPNVNARPGSNVKVLSQHFGNGAVAGSDAAAVTSHDAMANPRSSAGPQGNPPRALPSTPNLISGFPAALRRDSAPQAAPTPNDLIQARRGALPSARFAHPQGAEMPGSDAGPRESIRQPAGSYISSGDNSPTQPSGRPASTLPQVPQIRRAAPIDQPMPADNPQPPRFDRPENNIVPREIVPRESDRPQPVSQPSGQNYAPRYQQPVYQQPARQNLPPQQAQPRAQPRPAERAVKGDDRH